MWRISYRGLSIPLSLLLISAVLHVSTVARADYAYVKSIALPINAAYGQYPYGVAVDAYDNVWVADNSGAATAGTNCIREYGSDGTFIQKFGSTGNADGQFISPRDLAFDPSGNVWVANYFNSVGIVQEFDSSGTFIKSIGTYGSAVGQLELPHIAVDSTGNVWAANSYNGSVLEYSSAGALLQTLRPGFPFQVTDPSDIAVDSTGNVWIGDRRRPQILEITATGSLIQSIIPSGGLPGGLTFDKSGNLWSLWGGKVYELASDGTTIQSFFPINPNLQSGGISLPTNLAVDSLGNVWVTDPYNALVNEFAPVPEPGTVVLMAIGGVIALAASRRHRCQLCGKEIINDANELPSGWAHLPISRLPDGSAQTALLCDLCSTKGEAALWVLGRRQRKANDER